MAPLCELVNKYANVLTKLGKPIAQNIKNKTELLDLKKPIALHKLYKMSEWKFLEV